MKGWRRKGQTLIDRPRWTVIQRMALEKDAKFPSPSRLLYGPCDGIPVLRCHQVLLPVDWSCVVIANLLLFCIVAHT